MLHGLISDVVNNLKEFRDASPGFHFAIAGTFKEMAVALVSDVKVKCRCVNYSLQFSILVDQTVAQSSDT